MGTNRRDQISMDSQESRLFLEQGQTIFLASNGADGYPHLIAMWYALEDDDVLRTTYRKSQKVRNLQADGRCTLLLEEGESYSELKGLFLRGICEVIDDEETTFATLAKVGARAAGRTPDAFTLDGKAEEALRSRARKRVTLRFRTQKTRSWDHRKLGGLY